jgi:hypothetical protein
VDESAHDYHVLQIRVESLSACGEPQDALYGALCVVNEGESEDVLDAVRGAVAGYTVQDLARFAAETLDRETDCEECPLQAECSSRLKLLRADGTE